MPQKSSKKPAKIAQLQQRKLIYQVYPTAIGDLRDIAEHINYLAELKPDYIWLSPIYPSPWIDGGYDVADYCAIDPRFGSFNDFRHLIDVAKQHNIGILMDLVINHSSDQHEWFKKSAAGDRKYKDYYIWLDKPLNWRSFFGGSAFDFNVQRGQYYLHLYDKAQPDLNFKNPAVVKEFQKIVAFWQSMGVAGFRVDSANTLTENLRQGAIPRMTGFLNYYQTKETVEILDKIFAKRELFTIAEPVGGDFMTRKVFRKLTKNAFDAGFNIGTLDVADTFMSDKTRIKPINYHRWLKKLSEWSKEPKFSLALESHDTPRAVSRFHADAKALAMLQFCLPTNFPCIYQGQELGLKNPQLSTKISDYPGVLSHENYKQLLRDGHDKKSAMRIIRHFSRDNARQPLNWRDFDTQIADDSSVLNFYKEMAELWRTDQVLIHGKLKVKYINNFGVINFERVYGDRDYLIHIDLSGHSASFIKDSHGQKIIRSR